MNYRMVVYVLGVILRIEAGFLLLPAGVSLLFGEDCVFAFLLAAAALLLASLPAGFRRPENSTIYAREGFAIVALAWALMSVFGAVPFVLSGAIPHPVDAFFETVSGFTTTGASILNDVEALPRGLLFWRSFTHWVGGMGVLVFVMAVVSLSDGRSMYLMRAEVPGPSVGKLTPKSRSTAMILYVIYAGMTVLQTLLLLAGGMPFFDSVIHALGTAGTGGFSNQNLSVGAYDSAYIDWVITIFMLLFGVNFNLYYLLLLRRPKQVFKSEELRVYLILFGASALLIAANILPLYQNFGEALRYSAFQVATIMTTTGYATADFNLWPEFSRTLLVLLMLVGACAGSTAGGLKVSRVILIFKSFFRTVGQMLHPHSVRSIQFEGKPADKEMTGSVAVYLCTYLIFSAVSVLFVSLDGFSFETNVTAVVACVNNIGPGLGMVGPTGNYSAFSPLVKLILSWDMLVGRLEIFPMIMLFTPDLWRQNR